MDTSEIKSLLKLLDDNDKEVATIVENRLLLYNYEVLPIIKNELAFVKDELLSKLINDLINKIEFKHLLTQFTEWLNSPEKDLLQGVYLVSKYKYPNIDKATLIQSLEKIKLNAWLEMRHDITEFEKVKILNHAFYQQFGFSGNINDYQNSSNSFITDVIETKKGNPIMLCIIYMLVAQNLKLPIFGINLPQHFMLAYLQEDKMDLRNFDFNTSFVLNPNNKRVLFYINAFDRGEVFTKKSLEQFVHQMQVPSNPEFYLPCDNLTIIKRVLRNLVASYEFEKESEKKLQIFEILYLLGEPPLDHFTDVTNYDEE